MGRDGTPAREISFVSLVAYGPKVSDSALAMGGLQLLKPGRVVLNKQVLVRMWRKENPFALLVGMQTVATTEKSSKEIPQNIKNGSAFRPSYPTSGNISKGTQNTNSKEHRHPYVHCSVIYNCQDMEAAQVSISR